jgi:hypothetical protein
MKKINSDIYWEFNGFLWKWIYKKVYIVVSEGYIGSN